MSIRVDTFCRHLMTAPRDARFRISLQDENVRCTLFLQKLHMAGRDVLVLCDEQGICCQAYLPEDYIPFQGDSPQDSYLGVMRILLLHLCGGAEEAEIRLQLPQALTEKLKALRSGALSREEMECWFAACELTA